MPLLHPCFANQRNSDGAVFPTGPELPQRSNLELLPVLWCAPCLARWWSAAVSHGKGPSLVEVISLKWGTCRPGGGSRNRGFCLTSMGSIGQPPAGSEALGDDPGRALFHSPGFFIPAVRPHFWLAVLEVGMISTSHRGSLKHHMHHHQPMKNSNSLFLPNRR